MKTADFLWEHRAHTEYTKWALSISDDMADVWDALVEQDKYDWLMWTFMRPRVFPIFIHHKLVSRFIRETPIGGGKTVWDVLTDERSRRLVEVAEAFTNGKATADEFWTARAVAYEAIVAMPAPTHPDYEAVGAVLAPAPADYAASASASAAHVAADAMGFSFLSSAAYAIIYAAARIAAHVAHLAAEDANQRAALNAVYDTAYAAAYAAQIRMIAELDNPFKKRKIK